VAEPRVASSGQSDGIARQHRTASAVLPSMAWLSQLIAEALDEDLAKPAEIFAYSHY